MICTHHWLIEMANGPTSEGVCRYCNEQRTFTNSAAEWGPGERTVAAHKAYCSSLERRILAKVTKD